MQRCGLQVLRLAACRLLRLNPYRQRQQMNDCCWIWTVMTAFFFVSANAARLGLNAVAGCWPQWPHRLPVYAVGQGTASVLEQDGLTVTLPERADSEGLIALPALQAVSGQRFLLFRGQGGRELLRETLQARGASVTVIELYRRDLPVAAASQWQALSASDVSVVILTSPDALRHWQQVAGDEAGRLHWVVVSPRMHEMAVQAGARVMLAPGADTQSLLLAVQQLREALAI
jgi:uroporphyrinogen-III synthase